MPKALNSLLAGGWRDLLSLTWIRHGPDSKLWHDYLGAVDSLVLFTKDPDSEINLPELLRTIQDGLSSISSSHLPSAQIRDELRQFLEREVIVTQVESRELLALLVQLGVDYAQGTAIEKPGMLDSLV